MRDPSFYVSSLLELPEVDVPERRALFRQAMAALSRASSEDGPSPLEGLHPDVLLKGVQAAMIAGLVDDLDWLAPQAAGVALYTLAAALPASTEQRELGRRVLARMLAGNAETFTAIATSMALSTNKGIASPGIRARVALVSELPLSHGIADGRLALALASRREHARDWVANASMRSLPARRLAAKILERAAREATRRAQMGDSHALRVFAVESVRQAYERLLADRESLVWRYVAVARGLLAGFVPELKAELVSHVEPGLSPTEWRRAATSLAAFGAVRPEEALRMAQAVVKRGLFTDDDRVSAAAFVWGMARTIEAEPEAAQKMLDAVFAVAGPDVGDAVVELRFECGASKVVDRASRRALEIVRSAGGGPKGKDDGADGLAEEVRRDLEGTPREDEPIRSQVAAALEAFVTEGAPAAHARARDVLAAARAGTSALEAVAKDDGADGLAGSIARRTSMAVLRDLDASLLERHVVADLIRLGGSAEQVRASEDALDAVHERLAEWIVTRESPEAVSVEASDLAPKHATLRLRRLRALLHLVDGDLGEGLESIAKGVRSSEQESAEVTRAKRLRTLWLRSIKALLEHFETDPTPLLKRTLLAALARALDALVRVGVCDVVDALLVVAQRIEARRDFETLAEASMDPDLSHALSIYARFVRASEPALEIANGPESARTPPSVAGTAPLDRLASLDVLASELSPEGSPRSESLRTILVRLHTALVNVGAAKSLQGLSPASGSSDPVALDAAETWISALAQMCAGARSRLDPDLPATATQPAQARLLGAAVSAVLSGVEVELDEAVLGSAIDETVAGIPHAIGRLVSGVLWRLAELPVARPSAVQPPMNVAEPLPTWLPAHRTIGGFFVQRALGVGGTASVFVVTRSEDKHHESAERLALKVPDYNATAARSVSQEQFLKLFREEASALIMLPNHANLARFVTFDVGARPLPILVMELVEGTSLERSIGSRAFDVRRCLKVMDDVLAGLEAMHSAGIGHLDLKPSNVVLRKNGEGVLVDFGLAGRKIRSGCGTGPYGAPEVWVAPSDRLPTTPMKADIYSFGCVAFEMLTGKVLFEATSMVTQIAKHLAHDGIPDPMRALMADPDVAPLAEVLAATLRRDPRHRPTADELRRDIRAVASMVDEAAWPVPIGGDAGGA